MTGVGEQGHQVQKDYAEIDSRRGVVIRTLFSAMLFSQVPTFLRSRGTTRLNFEGLPYVRVWSCCVGREILDGGSQSRAN